MNNTDLFQLALGLTPPWYVSETRFNAEVQELHITIDFLPGSEFACTACAEAGCKVHDSKERVWRHLNFFQHKTFIHARVPRTKCPRCGKVHQVSVPWSRPGSGFTLLFEAYVMTLVREMPVRSAARIVHEHDSLLWRILHHYVHKARRREDLSTVEKISVDETARAKGHKYVSLIMDAVSRRVIFATEGKGADVLPKFIEDLQSHGGCSENITDVCMDMSPAFISGVEKHLPESAITFDKFHVIKLLNEAVDQVRREEQKTMPELKGNRYIWLKNKKNLTMKQKAVMDDVLSQRHSKTARAYQLRLTFQEMYEKDPMDAPMFLKKWYFWATHSRLEPIKTVAYTMKRHYTGILRWFVSNITNGLHEGINSLIQAAKRKARGYRSVRNFIAIIYLVAGGLDISVAPARS
ncbi:ISL3 family transposase [Heliobacterium undosum]|uniref:ISL3 family transposase n=1 Tax=Heliomicrobium undosum TaxID=121734 RepID=A0A845L2V9_9FIRM|nr:ISL3 family transposase [Heliomicrobium undosum]MZP30593.1 ISL3 family transposase [Heliomicrobium undosum]